MRLSGDLLVSCADTKRAVDDNLYMTYGLVSVVPHVLCKAGRKIEKMFMIVKILITLITLKLFSQTNSISLAFYLGIPIKKMIIFLIKIYQSNILYYFKFSNIKKRTRSGKRDPYLQILYWWWYFF